MSDAPHEPLVATPEDLADLVAHLRDSGRFAFDTEFVSEDTFEPVLCLIQVATQERLAAVDPLALGDMATFWEVVNDPTIEVVMHAAGEDLRIDSLSSGRLPERVVDVQVAAGLVGFGYPLSLGNLVFQTLGVSLVGGETRTDWRRRPLSDGQLRYALDDVRYLLDAADWFNARLDELGRRDWAEIEYRSLIESIRARDDEDRWRRLSGLNPLTRRGLELARRLSEWRRAEARRSNRPLRHILRDDLLIAIAKRAPSSRRDLEALRDFNRPNLIARSNEILDLRQHVPMPVAFLTKAEASNETAIRCGKLALGMHADFPTDRGEIERYAKLIPAEATLSEPFERVREALEETLRLGTARSA